MLFVLHYNSAEQWVSKCQYRLGNTATLVGVHNVNIDRTRLGHERQICIARSMCQSCTLEQRWCMHQQPSNHLNHFFGSVTFTTLKKSPAKAHCVDRFSHKITLQVSQTTKLSRTPPNIHPVCDDEKVVMNKRSSTFYSRSLLSLAQSINQCTHLLAPVWHSMQTRLYRSSTVLRAGHNKWSKVKHKKKFTDLEKSTTIHKYVTLIASAIKVGPGGADPDSNVRLANIIESARKAGMSVDQIMHVLTNKVPYIVPPTPTHPHTLLERVRFHAACSCCFSLSSL